MNTLTPIVGTIVGLATVAGVIYTFVSGFNNFIDNRIYEKLNNPQFIKQLASQLRFPFVIFDEDEKFLYDSGTEPYRPTVRIAS